eukprot:TRINITY_DN29863_c0_g1_i1.p1 TRINITY_DN29863_c0_g1~~TRINITY_DN29863_c0_g1_i1.p1  ORF type:complete len:610 (-),score=100.54 TRINITY_DN29863_c0_g1_i1:289-2118(-)
MGRSKVFGKHFGVTILSSTPTSSSGSGGGAGAGVVGGGASVGSNMTISSWKKVQAVAVKELFYEDYPSVKEHGFSEIPGLDFEISESEEDGGSAFARKFGIDFSGSQNICVSPRERKKTSEEVSKKPRAHTSQKLYEMEVRRGHIAREVLATEKTYVDGLSVIIDSYQVPMMSKCTWFDEPPETIALIFGNVNILHGFNKNLLVEIEAVVENWNPDSELGDKFCKLSPFLKMYTDYSHKYSEAIALLYRLERKNTKFKSVVDECHANSHYQLHLNDLLIIPIQRIPRYSLLLSDLLRNTSEDHPDHPALKQALKALQEIAVKVNESVKRRENTMRLDEMQKEGFDLSKFVISTRYLIKDGVVKVKLTKHRNEQKTMTTITTNITTTTTEAQYWILFNDIFVRCKKDLVKHVDLNDYSISLSLVWLKQGGKEVSLTLPSETLTFSDEVWEGELATAIENFLVFSDTLPKFRKYVVDDNSLGLRTGEFQDSGTGHYIGQWLDGERHGKGRWSFKGNRYHGDWKEDKPHGRGRWTYPSGSMYVGEFQEGIPFGRGVLRTIDGNCFTGNFCKGLREDLGKIVFANGYLEKRQDRGRGPSPLQKWSSLFWSMGK